MRAVLGTLASLLLLAASAFAAPLDLPVQRAGEVLAPPFYRGDVIEIRLAPIAARLAHPARAGAVREGRRVALGVRAVDALAGALGVTAFEPEFVGEPAPRAGDDRHDLTAFHVVHLPAGVALEDALERFRALPEVASADPIAVLPVSAVWPDDSLFARQQWMRDDGAPRHDDRILDAWNVTRGDTGIVVGVLDTGVLAWHPDLGGTVAGESGNLFVNRVEAAGLPGVDDDGNGFVDDVSGWDFVDSVTVATGEDGRGKDNDPSDVAGHGTAVAGIIGALVNNARGIAGMTPNVRLLPVRCAYAIGARPAAGVDMLAAARSIAYATRMGATVLNCSWQSLNQGGLGAAATNAVRAGVTLVNASGNGLSAPAYLGQREDVVAVGGVDSTDVMYPSMTRGTWVDLCAQAMEVTSTFVTGSGPDSLGYRQPDYRSSLVGTSFAAPQVTGAVALMQARRRELGLDPLTPIGVALRLRETADPHPAANATYFGFIGTGRLNVLRALTDGPTSTATRGRARHVGAPLVLALNSGETRVVYATSDQRLVALDGVNADTLFNVALPAAPAGSPAAAEMGDGTIGVFVACAGRIAGYDENGAVRPGWPVVTGGNPNAVALGDLDGTGGRELVYVSSDGTIGALRAGGGLVPGFPISATALGGAAPALAELDGVPGDEVVFVDGNAELHVYGAGAAELPGFPVACATGARAPIVVALGTAREQAIVVAGSGRMDAITVNGNVRWSNSYAGGPAQDPFAGDLDGDGVDEVFVALSSPLQLRAVDSAGVAVSRAGWPLTLGAAPLGVPVMGPLAAGRTCVGWFTSAGFAAWDDSARVVSTFPRPGFAGALPGMGDFDGDGATELAAGSSANDSSFYAFDAGPATWDRARAYWPTVRGNIARTADRGTPASLAPLDVIRPAPPQGVLAEATSNTSVRVRWTMSGDDSLAGRAEAVELRYASPTLEGPAYFSAPAWPVGVPDSSGVLMEAEVTGLEEGRVWAFALRARDDAGRWSAVSAADTARLVALAPDAVADLAAGAPLDTTLLLRWSATGEDGSSGRPASYTIVANTEPVTYANFGGAPITWQRAATADAGAPESLLVTGLSRGRRWYFALRATDHAGGVSALSNVVEAITPMGGALGARTGMAVAPATRPGRVPLAITWQAGASLSGTPLTLALFDVNGRLVQRVRLGNEPGGVWTWDGRDSRGRDAPAGMYFARLDGGPRHVETRVVLLR